MRIPGRRIYLVLLCAVAAILLTGTSASAGGIVAKDGKIHACYKAKGKGKGTLRVVRNAKVRCPRKWRKVSWYASGAAGPQGTSGSPGANGETGTNGSDGLPGAPATATVVKQLEGKVTELLNEVASLETILNGIDNQQLKEAIAGIAKTEALEAAVGSLCTQASALTSKSGELGSALGGLSTVLATLTVMALPAVPTALPPFSCP
ncbi:MAG TPA: collagen-like protein [Solirubrobacterales bacterium]|nr:collagen-like protein [Solirubrobacterales bacterium]